MEDPESGGKNCRKFAKSDENKTVIFFDGFSSLFEDKEKRVII